MDDKYLYFGDVCLDGKLQCKESYEIAVQLYDKLPLTTSNRDKRNKKAKSSWEAAHASETALKAFLIYTEFTNMPIFNNPKTINRSSGENHILLRSEKDKNGNLRDIYSIGFYPGYQEHNQIWRKLLDGRRDELPISEQSKFSDRKSFGMIGDPRILLPSIRQYALDGDFRLDSNFMINDPIHSYDFTKTISGHDLFAYLKIQNPANQGIINNELFLLGNQFSKEEKIIGILEGYGNSVIQSNSNQENIYTNSLAFPKRRFDWITGEEISDADLKTVLDFAKINLDLAEFKFPGDDIDRFEYLTKLDYSEYNHTVFRFLDPVCKYYVKLYFTSEEVNIIDSIAKIEKLKPSDISMFVNMCVYYKYYIREILQDNSQVLNFDKSEHARNLLLHTNNMKSYDANGTAKLEDSHIFISNIGNISKISEQIKQEKLLETESNSIDKNLEDIIKICNINGIIPNEIILKKTPEEIQKILEVCKMNGIIPEGSVFRKSAEEVQKLIEVCKANGIKPEGTVFRQTSEEVQKLIEVCKANGIAITGSMFMKSAEEIQKIIEVCKMNGIIPEGSVFRKSAEEVQKLIEVCKANGIAITGSVFMKSAEEIQKIIEVCKMNGIIPRGYVFSISTEKLNQTIEFCKEAGIDFDNHLAAIQTNLLNKKKELLELLNIDYNSKTFLISTDKIIERYEMCKSKGINCTNEILLMSEQKFNQLYDGTEENIQKQTRR